MFLSKILRSRQELNTQLRKDGSEPKDDVNSNPVGPLVVLALKKPSQNSKESSRRNLWLSLWIRDPFPVS